MQVRLWCLALAFIQDSGRSGPDEGHRPGAKEPACLWSLVLSQTGPRRRKGVSKKMR